MVVNKLEAIETIYGGYRFRSRLEARWAVFFDSMVFQWRYEDEGFKLPSGYYLPDFWFPQVSMFGEVKPDVFKERELRLAHELAEVSGHGVILLEGLPDCRMYWTVFPPGHYIDGQLSDVMWDGHRYWESESRLYECSGITDYPTVHRLHEEHDTYGCNCCDAVQAARSARFEYGERG